MELLYFLAGFIFFELIYPLLNTAFEVLSTKLEAVKAKDALKITQINSDIKTIQEKEILLEKKTPIGFTSTSIEEAEEPEEVFEEEDDVENDD